MNRRPLTALAALALFVSVGTANADGPMPANPMPGHDAQHPAAPPTDEEAPKAAKLNLDFGKLPEGWETSRNPNGEMRGIINVVANMAAEVHIMVFAGEDNVGLGVEAITKHAAESARKAGHIVSPPTKDAKGNWSCNVTYMKDGKEVGKGLAVFRTFKNDPTGVYFFKADWPVNAPAAMTKKARAIILGAKLK